MKFLQTTRSLLRAPLAANPAAVGSSLADAQSLLNQQLGLSAQSWTLATESFEQSIRGDIRGPLFALAGLSLLVLLVAATNAAHLVLTRGRQRAAAFGVMDALGASRADMASIVLAETALLAASAAAFALMLCWLVWRLSPDLSESGLPIDPSLGSGLILDVRMVLVAVALSALAMLLAGAYPAWLITRSGASSALRSQRSGTRSRHWLSIPGTALSLVALFCAVVFLQSSRDLQNQPLGLNVDGVVNAQIFMRGESATGNGPHFAARAQALLEAAQRIPGAKAVAISNGVPFTPVFGPRREFKRRPSFAWQRGAANHRDFRAG